MATRTGKIQGNGVMQQLQSYQAVRARIRYREKPSEPTKYLHTLNSTLVATERAIVAILENYQKPDGTIRVPEVLRKYMGGQETIPGPKEVTLFHQGTVQKTRLTSTSSSLRKSKESTD